MNTYFNCHTHTVFSNIRLLDCINQPDRVIQKAIDLGLSGLAITDHECLSAAVEVNKIAIKLHETNPDFRIALGNEIYLTDTRESGQKYYHFILIAKDALGHRALRELSSTAWFYSYSDRGLERVPTLKSELEEVMKKYKGHVIATSACIGGELSSNALLMAECEEHNDMVNARVYYQNIVNFISYVQKVFGEDFYIECAPAASSEQIKVNKKLLGIARYYNIKMTVGTDAHYLTKEDRYVHKAYLNSKDGDREVDSFYEYTYMMSADEARELLRQSFDDDTIDWLCQNSQEIQNKIEFYSLAHKQDVPSIEVKDYPKRYWVTVNGVGEDSLKYPHLSQMLHDDDIQNRYWVNQCIDKLYELGKLDSDDGEKYLTELEEEARVKSIISEKLETNMFRYPNTLQHYVDMFWESGSMVGAGRGSSCAALNHYLLGITQLDPIEWNLPFFRYMNEDRIEPGDIDLDLCPSKRPVILQNIKDERSSMFNDNVQDWAKENLGCTLIATFGTEATKSAVLTACRGYRSEDFPEGIDNDEAQYISSLIPQERGFLWSVRDVVYGDPDKGRRPVAQFINEVNNYPGLLDIIMAIEGLKNKRSSHASGVVLFDGDPFERCAFMKTPKGEIITQFDLHDAEWMGLMKYDFLVTEVQDKLVQAIELLQKDGQIEPELSLREVYNKYFHPNVLPLNDEKIWDALDNVSVLNTFQFDSPVGMQTAKKIKPRTIQEMSSANGLMRLMGEDNNGVRPLDKYVNQKNNISLWYKEMRNEGLTEKEQQIIKPYFEQDYGVPPDQESLMLMLMDKDICDFSLAEANAARKIIGKKQMSKIPELKNKIFSQAKSPQLGQYIWLHGASPQLGYSFSRIHSLAYSFIGVQTLYIATHWNPIYWNTACLIVNSGATDPDNGGQTDYTKLAKSLGDIKEAGIQVSLVDINKSGYGFTPDVENNTILYGMKAMLNVGDDVIDETIMNRPYHSIKDYYQKVHPKKTSMLSLIKGGAFDNMMNRKEAMIWYIWEVCDKKSRLTLQNMASLIKYNLLPEDTEERITARRVYEFNRYLKSVCKLKSDSEYYHLDERAINFLTEMDYVDMVHDYLLNMKEWDKKVYQKWMDVFRNWIAEDKNQILQNLNYLIFKEDWDKYAKGNYSSWEMEALCFYYHEHELANIDNSQYGFEDFYSLPESPEVESSFRRGNKTINLFVLHRIAGTCIAKNKTKSTVELLTTDGVVTVKFRKEYFALFDKQISERQPDGTKKIVEKSWFNKGNKIIVTGIRSGDDFIVKKYNKTPGHQLYKIDEVYDNGTISIRHERAAGVSEDCEDAA